MGPSYKLEPAWGTISFGSRRQLSTIIGKVDGYAAHHILPWNLFEKFENPKIKKLVEAGFHPNQLENGINLPIKIKKENWAGDVITETFHGNHPNYLNYIIKRLNAVSSLEKEALINEVKSKIIPDVIKKINEAELFCSGPKGIGYNLDKYFKEFVK